MVQIELDMSKTETIELPVKTNLPLMIEKLQQLDRLLKEINELKVTIEFPPFSEEQITDL